MTDSVDEWLLTNEATREMVRHFRRTVPKNGKGENSMWTGPTYHPCSEDGELSCNCKEVSTKRGMSDDVEAFRRPPPVVCRGMLFYNYDSSASNCSVSSDAHDPDEDPAELLGPDGLIQVAE